MAPAVSWEMLREDLQISLISVPVLSSLKGLPAPWESEVGENTVPLAGLPLPESLGL